MCKPEDLHEACFLHGGLEAEGNGEPFGSLERFLATVEFHRSRLFERSHKAMPKTDALKTVPEECEYSFFSHTKCEYFPCHKTNAPEDFNCLFCYCPLYALNDKCGGNFRYTESGIKDCSACLLPHNRKSYSYIVSKFKDIAEITRRKEGE